MACNREYTKKGQSCRRFAVEEASARALGPGRRQSSWQVRLLEAADSEDANLRLWAGVMRDAIEALTGSHPDARGQRGMVADSAPALWREACAWVMARDEKEAWGVSGAARIGEVAYCERATLGTFESVCEVLGLDVETARRDLCAMAMEHAPIQTHEVWLYKNPEALARVQRGLAQSAAAMKAVA